MASDQRTPHPDGPIAATAACDACGSTWAVGTSLATGTLDVRDPRLAETTARLIGRTMQITQGFTCAKCGVEY